MTTVPNSAAAARAEADQHDRWARALRDHELTSVHLRSGHDTWRGPTATRCWEELNLARTMLRRAAAHLENRASELRGRARALEAELR